MPQLISANNSPREPHQIGANQQRLFDMTDKDVDRGTEAERPSEPDRPP
jgi:hypothetical protein